MVTVHFISCHKATIAETSGGLSQNFAGSGQNQVTAKKTKLEPGQVTKQGVILLLPSLIDNIYFVICIGLMRSYLRL